MCEVADDGPWWKLGDHLVPRRAPRAVALCELGDLGAPLGMPPHSSTRAPLSLLIASPDLLFLAEQGEGNFQRLNTTTRRYRGIPDILLV